VPGCTLNRTPLSFYIIYLNVRNDPFLGKSKTKGTEHFLIVGRLEGFNASNQKNKQHYVNASKQKKQAAL
jgi:hypothetical protein